jgi:beta-galactosidase
MRHLRLVPCLILGAGLGAADTPAFAWAEGESPAVAPAARPGVNLAAAWGRSSIMSGGKLLHITIDEKDAAALDPAGITAAYDLRGAGAGRRELWARIGYEWARAPMRWRVAGAAAWNGLAADSATTDVMPIQTWNELGWIRLGDIDAPADGLRIELNWPRTEREDKGQKRPNRILGMLDCLCLAAPGAFRPAGLLKPGQDHRSDADRDAAARTFALPEAAGPERQRVALDGGWELANWDEEVVDPADRLGPVQGLPDLAALRWFSMAVPGDRNQAHPEFAFHHRFLLRTRVQVPASQAGRSFHLDIQRFSAIASVFVNGRLCAWSKNHSTAWQPDITAGIRAGQSNEIVVAVKDRYYSLDAGKDPKGWRGCWNLPDEFLTSNQGVANRHQLAIAADPTCGLTEPVALVAAGPTYLADAFVKTSVQRQELAAELTLANPGATPRTVSVACSVVPWSATGADSPPVKTLAPLRVTIEPGAARTVELKDAWGDPRLWWPDDVHLYQLVTAISEDGRPVDTARTRFGFREWTWDSSVFRLNGVKWQSWADLDQNYQPQELVRDRARTGRNLIRLWSNGGLGKMTRREVLDYCDEHGVLVRESGTFDGQLANYSTGLTEEAVVDGKKRRVARQVLFANWTEQLKAWTRTSRNHPSLFIWSAENEVTYINSANLGQRDQAEPAIRTAIRDGIQALDPTRPVMVDGGNALTDESMPVNGGHYTEFDNTHWRDLPDATYSLDHLFAPGFRSRGIWTFAAGRPIMNGEVFFAEGYTTDRFATVGGDRCFIGRSETTAARGLLARIFSEGWRWGGMASWHFWLADAGSDYLPAWQPVSVLCRQWAGSFGAGEQVARTLKVFNNTSRSEPITAAWELTIGGRRAADGRQDFPLAPGSEREWRIGFAIPALAASAAGELVVTAARGGKEVFRQARPIRVLIPASVPKPALSAAELAVFDPSGLVTAHLTARGIAHSVAVSADDIPAAAKVLVVGPDAIPAGLASDTRWYARADAGLRVLVLDQRHPLRYRALPADLDPLDDQPSGWEVLDAKAGKREPELRGRIAFAEDLTHPAFAGLDQADLFTWGDDHVVYRQPYRKGTRGFRSLVQCEESLACTALAECQTGDGLMLLSQLAIGGKLASNAVAQQAFAQLLNYAAGYAPARRAVTAATPADGQIARLLGATGVKHRIDADPLAAIAQDGLAVIDATPANLKALAGRADAVRAWCAKGNWMMLWGVSPDSLADFNALVRWNHVLRPFSTERVLLAVPADPLSAGLTLRDVVLDTGASMYPWMSLKRPDDNEFSWIVDHTDIAPFCTFPAPTAMGKSSDTDPGTDHWPRNMVNGFTSDDNWAFCYTIQLDKGHARRWTIELPKAEELAAIRIRPSRIYHPITHLTLRVDDDPTPIPVALRADPVTQEVALPAVQARRLTLEIDRWQERGDANIVVIDNLWLMVRRPDGYLRRVKPLLNIGGLVRYDEGRGGFLLNQIKLVEREVNPGNADKKRNLVKTLLANLGAVFAGQQTVIAGQQLAYAPVAIPDSRFNAYVGRGRQPAWFAGPGDLSALPVGEQAFAGVRFRLADFTTSPVPSAFMLRGRGATVKEAEIAGIAIGRSADALFLLHTCAKGGDLDGWERQVRQARERGKPLPEAPVLLTYRIRYEDGQTAEIPVRWGRDIGHWAVKDPRALPNAALAWTAPLADAKAGEQAAVWMMQWTNPRPAAAIAAVDLVAGEEKWGACAVLAITTATVRK